MALHFTTHTTALSITTPYLATIRHAVGNDTSCGEAVLASLGLLLWELLPARGVSEAPLVIAAGYHRFLPIPPQFLTQLVVAIELNAG